MTEGRIKLDYEVVIPWPKLKEHLERKVQETAVKLETCKLEDVEKLRGQLLAYRSLLNLPGTLTIIEEEDERELPK